MSKPTIVTVAQPDLMATILGRIEALAASERITKAELGAVSREILTYITLNGGNDIGTVNRLIGVLTPMNKRTACLFFDNFLPFTFDEDKGNFGNKVKGDKRITEYVDKAQVFMADDDNNIWTWADDNLKLEVKPKDYAKKLTNLVHRALNDDKGEEIDQAEVINAVLSGGLTVGAIMVALEAISAEAEAEVNGVPAPEVDAA